MRTEVYGCAVLPVEGQPEVVYTMLCDDAPANYPLGCEMYGVQVEMGGETAVKPRLTASKTQVGALLDKLVRGTVTPTSLDDVLEDWASVIT